MLPLACVLQVVGLSTDYWTSGEEGRLKTHDGLWRTCRCNSFLARIDDDLEYRCDCQSLNNPGWLRIVQGLQIMGGVGFALLCLLSLISYAMHIVPMALRRFKIFACFFTAAMILTGCIMYGVLKPSHKDINYSVCLCIVASFFSVVTGILLQIDLHTHRSQRSQPVLRNSDIMSYFTNPAGPYDSSLSIVDGGFPRIVSPPPYDESPHTNQVDNDAPPSYESLKAQGFI